MSTLKAEVKNGRLTMDEPTELPEGTVLELAIVEADNADPFANLDAESRARLNASIDRGLAEADAGLGRPMEEFLDEL